MAKRSFKSLSEREILALAVHMEQEDSRVYGDFADGLREEHPVAAKAFDEMQTEELSQRERLVEPYRQRFGAHIPLVRCQDVSGFAERRPVWLRRPVRMPAVRKQVELMESEAPRFYERAAKRVDDGPTRKLLEELEKKERQHADFA